MARTAAKRASQDDAQQEPLQSEAKLRALPRVNEAPVTTMSSRPSFPKGKPSRSRKQRASGNSPRVVANPCAAFCCLPALSSCSPALCIFI
jgi:hypothetical protein